MRSVVTANLLRSGAVVYLAAGSKWVPDLADAYVADTPADRKQQEEAALASVLRNEVTAVYAMDVRVTDGRPEPVSVRERIRSGVLERAGP